MAVELSTKTGNVLQVIGSRNRFIDEAYQQGDSGFLRRREPLHSLLVRGIERVVIGRVRLIGEENIDLIKGKAPITIAPNHTSDIDHGCLEYALVANGYSEVADRLLFAAGLKMWDRPQTSWGMAGMNTFPTAPPGYFLEAVRARKSVHSDEDREKINRYLEKLKGLNEASWQAIGNPWQKGEVIVVMYPEATRSRDGLLKKGKKETGRYFEQGVSLPMMIKGSHEGFPPEQNPHWDKVLLRRLEVSVSVGQPIDADYLHTSAVRSWLKERKATPVDFIMSRIAALDPERVDLKYRPFYESLTNDIPEGLLLKAA